MNHPVSITVARKECTGSNKGTSLLLHLIHNISDFYKRSHVLRRRGPFSVLAIVERDSGARFAVRSWEKLSAASIVFKEEPKTMCVRMKASWYLGIKRARVLWLFNTLIFSRFFAPIFCSRWTTGLNWIGCPKPEGGEQQKTLSHCLDSEIVTCHKFFLWGLRCFLGSK